ncbi:MAG: MFS transporter [Solirubrobacteraceae bacterium]|nr:MFS transporter [Solirubrobacteraceae bacterium]
MTTLSPTSPTDSTFAALRVRNYRTWFAGQAVSLVGTWMQSVALSWLAFELSASGSVIGFVMAAQFVPVLVLGAYGGLLADRMDKRRLLLLTQGALGTLSLLLAVLVLGGLIALWMVFVIAVLLGVAVSVDTPTRQSFVIEMVGAEHVQNAVSLNSILVNASRAVGPAMAGVLIAAFGVGVCFAVNAASFVAVLAALVLMRRDELLPAPPLARARGQLRDGLRYVRGTPELAVPLVMMGIVGCFAYEFPVVLPLVAREALHGGPTTFGLLTSAMGVGAVAGGLVIASRRRTGTGALSLAAVGFGVAIALAAAAPGLGTALAAMLLVGAGSVAFMSTGNTTLQLTAAPEYRGRVMALWAVTFQGSTPIGGPIIGAISEFAGPRIGLGVGAAACLLAALVGLGAVER